MPSIVSLRRAFAVASRASRPQLNHVQEARSRARPAVVFSRRFASGSPAPTGPKPAVSEGGAAAQPQVTKEMLMDEGYAILRYMIGGVAVVSALIASSGFVIESMKRVNPKPAPGRFVALQDEEGNTVQVHHQYFGEGNVTVIFDGGVGETSFDWDKVAQDVGQFATVLSIDRPGLGFSTASQSPRTAMQIAKEYRDVMTKLNIQGDVVLVAHGAGGYNMRELAQNLEQDTASLINVKGLVLVDSLQENLRAELESVSEPVRQALQTMDKNGDTVLLLSYIGFIRLITNIQRKKNEAKYSAEALPYVEFFTPTPAHRRVANEENLALPVTEDHFRDAKTTEEFGFPCVVLSHSRPDMFDSMKTQPGVDVGTIAELEQTWQNAQRLLAKTVGSTPATHIVVPDAGHCIHHEKPEEISKIVRALVEEANHKGAVSGLVSIQDGTCPI